jgi:hypothetical protein
MSDVQQQSQHRRSMGSLLLELAMIGVGVFLGASAEQWRETRHHRELATASLRNFRREIADNRAQVASLRSYHTALGESTGKFIEAKVRTRSRHSFTPRTGMASLPVEFKHTAWDLALATQALSDIEPRLAFAVSDVYAVQQTFDTMQHDLMQTVFTPATFEHAQDATGLAGELGSFFEDVNIQEPRLLELYDKLLPQIDSASAIDRRPRRRLRKPRRISNRRRARRASLMAPGDGQHR